MLSLTYLFLGSFKKYVRRAGGVLKRQTKTNKGSEVNLIKLSPCEKKLPDFQTAGRVFYDKSVGSC